ncbi:MAG: hypothetical protein GX431_03995 [Bacteroidales bacterium]|jgi:beta-galactosidase|nr:hypothetical protein [Bacteroidales bacterium]
MKKSALRVLITVIVLASGSIVSAYEKQSLSHADSRDRLFNSGWRFVRDSLSGAAYPGFDDSGWMTIDLPHDYSIMDLPGDDGPDQTGPFSRLSPGNGNSNGHFIGGTGWYRKTFTLDTKDSGKTVILKFDGVYMESQVWVNGKEAGIHKNGYTPFWFDITSLLNGAGKPNLIAVKVDNPGRNSRWYSGSGIYRDVIWDNSKVEINVHSLLPEGFAENLSGWGWPDELPSWSWKGRAQVVIRPTGKSTVTVSAESPGLGKEQAFIKVLAN